MKSIKALTVLILIALLLGSTTNVVSALAFNPEQEIITPHSYQSVNQLVQASDTIGFGVMDGVTKQFRTPVTVSHGKLVNTVQRFQIKQAFKGAKIPVSILITGVEPLPRPSDPLNQIYPGPLSSGSYVLFLKKIDDTNYYQLTGGWQGVYPILNNKSVALYGIGFKELDQLSVNEFFHILKSRSSFAH